MAHELTHTIQQKSVRKNMISRQVANSTSGETVYNNSRQWLNTDQKVKEYVDRLKAAIREIKTGKSVEYNKNAGIIIIDQLGKILSLSSSTLNQQKIRWKWLIDNRNQKSSEKYKTSESLFFSFLNSPLKNIKKKYPKQQVHYWLKHTPAKVFDIILQVADKNLKPDELWLYAFKEGLTDYIRNQLGLLQNQHPAATDLLSVNVNKEIDSFNFLGMDDFYIDLEAKNFPAKQYLPATFDMSQLREVKHTNEQGREVRSALFPSLKTALQGFAAIMKRRRNVFLADAKKHGYGTPNQEELVYWTYLYYNVGEYVGSRQQGGKGQLIKYKGKRKLSDWIDKGEYPNVIKVLQSYQMIHEMKIFP